MAPAEPIRRLIVNADDFGRSASVNHAVIQAHRHGILTTASLMVNGQAADEAIDLARQNPTLGVGLHLTLVCGRATLGHDRIPNLVNSKGEFSTNPLKTGLAYYFRPALRAQLALEIEAQLDKFTATGLPLDHINGHLNLHLHPTVFRLLMPQARKRAIRAMRLTRDRFWLNLRLAQGRCIYRISHALIFNLLSLWARPALRQANIHYAQTVFGLLQNGCVDEPFLCRLLPQLPAGDSELYSHPSLDKFNHELAALVSPRVQCLVPQHHIKLIRYQEL